MADDLLAKINKAVTKAFSNTRGSTPFRTAELYHIGDQNVGWVTTVSTRAATPCLAVRASFSQDELQSARSLFSDEEKNIFEVADTVVKFIILQTSPDGQHVEVGKADHLTFDGETYLLSTLKKDPANAIWVCAGRKIA